MKISPNINRKKKKKHEWVLNIQKRHLHPTHPDTPNHPPTHTHKPTHPHSMNIARLYDFNVQIKFIY